MEKRGLRWWDWIGVAIFIVLLCGVWLILPPEFTMYTVYVTVAAVLGYLAFKLLRSQPQLRKVVCAPWYFGYELVEWLAVYVKRWVALLWILGVVGAGVFFLAALYLQTETWGPIQIVIGLVILMFMAGTTWWLQENI